MSMVNPAIQWQSEGSPRSSEHRAAAGKDPSLYEGGCSVAEDIFADDGVTFWIYGFERR